MEFNETFLLEIDKSRQSAGGQAKARRYLTLLDPRPGQRILDLGCGSGIFSRMLAPLVAPGGQVVGLDSAPEAVELAARLSGAAGPAWLTFEQGDGHQLRFETVTFDGALCIAVLMYCQDPGRVLRELRRVLRPGGRLVVANTDEDSRAFNSQDRELGRRIIRVMADRTREPWLARRLAYLLRGAGFNILKEIVETGVERDFSPGTSGYAVARGIGHSLLAQTCLSSEDYQRWLADLQARAREGSYCYNATRYVYLAEA
jgi:arsenite methyltransferase